MKVNIIDAMMGTGKTSAMINYINNSDDDTKFFYITPYLTEVDRIVQMCSSKNFKQPVAITTTDNFVLRSKLEDVKKLFINGENIVSTHSLFKHFDEDTIQIARDNNYVLIMDEVADVIQPLSISRKDLTYIMEKYAEIVDGHLLKWTDMDYVGAFEWVWKLCDLGCVGVYNDVALMWLLPVSTFKGFREIYLLTYLFEAQTQKYYFDLYEIEYNYLYIQNNNGIYNITENAIDYEKKNIKDLINICDVKKLNNIGSQDNSLSSTWYKQYKSDTRMQVLKNNTNNFFKNYAKTPTSKNLWTTFKDYVKILKGKGYATAFIPSNTRATNDYRDRVSVAYLINKYFNPLVKNFFTSKGIQVNEDLFALSEMIQFIWRSAIRDGKPIQLYIPSKRMRDILINWIEEISEV